MGLAPGVQLSLKQQQSLVMTPQLQQAIKMLQLNRTDLIGLVEDALANNPLLERADLASAGSGEAGGDSMLLGRDGNTARLSQSQAQNQDQKQSQDQHARLDHPATARDQTGDVTDQAITPTGNDGASALSAHEDAAIYPLDWREEQRLEAGMPTRDLAQPEQRSTQAFELTSSLGDNDAARPLDFAAPKPSLQAHISQALPLMFADPYDRKIAEHLCLYLSPAGYLESDTEALAEQLGVDGDVLERIVVTLQEIEPAGLFARNLSECLRLQLQDRGLMSPLLGRLLSNLDALIAMPVAKAAEALDCDQEAYLAALATLRRLDPKPGAGFEREGQEALEADIFLQASDGGGWLIELNNSDVPRLLVNHSFVERHKRSGALKREAQTARPGDLALARRQAEQRYIAEQWQSANWLISALEQRASTTLRVAAALVHAQSSFFDQGLYALRPLSQRQLAESLDLHESTISRVCSNKVISTPRGTFELKFFFSSGVGGGEDDGQSAKAVQAHIKRIIDEEDRKKPLSDDKIVKILKAQEIGLARRTVTKYREALGFASSVQRKRQYAEQS